ncbi:MAG: hypothetical protein Q4A05_01715 [Ruminococcus sp.]|nr:hypothetical protein [Ruminococcus sp.]
MAIARYESAPSGTLIGLYDFLEAHKEGTFLENVVLSLESSSDGARDAKMFLGSYRNFFFSCTGTVNNSAVVSYTGTYTSLTFDNYTDSSKVVFQFASAILCTNGLILSGYDMTDEKAIQRIIITVDDSGGLAVIVPAKNACSFAATDTDYKIIVADSTTPTLVSVGPSYSTNVTCLVPVAPKAMSTTRMLPYVYAALTTQLNTEGLQSVEIDGVPYITNGVWYIKDDGE